MQFPDRGRAGLERLGGPYPVVDRTDIIITDGLRGNLSEPVKGSNVSRATSTSHQNVSVLL